MMFAKVLALASASLGMASAFINPMSVRVVRQTSVNALSMVKAGEMAPDFALKDADGKTVKLSSFKGKKSVVLFFYPKDNTPGCTKEACSFNENLDAFKKVGAEVIGISSDADHTDFKKKYALGMSLLSDVGGKVRGEYKVPKSMFGTLDGRVTYVIDKSGKVVKIHDNLIDSESHINESKAALGIK